MIQSITKEEFFEHYQILNDDLRDAIFSEITADSISRIGAHYAIFDEDLAEVARLIGRVLLGLLSPNRLAPEIAELLGIDIDVAGQIAQDINKQIFFPVRDSLRTLYGANTNVEVELTPTTKRPSSQSAFPGAKTPEQIIPQRRGEITFEAAKTTPELPPALIKPQTPTTKQNPFSISKEEVEEIRPTLREETKTTLQESQAPHNLPITEKMPQQKDPYKERLADDDVKDKFSIPGTQNEQKPKPRIDGNIIDLKSINTD